MARINRINSRTIGTRVKNILRAYGFEVRGDVLQPFSSGEIKLTVPVLWNPITKERPTLEDANQMIPHLLDGFLAAGIAGKHVVSIKPVTGDTRIPRRAPSERNAWNFVCNIAGAAVAC